MDANSTHSLPGINVDDALFRLGIDWNKYLGLLHKFANDIKTPMTELPGQLSQQDWEGARRHAMTISVECMKLCADDLRQQSKNLDQAVRTGSADAKDLWSRLESDLTQLLQAIAACDNPFEEADVQELLNSLYDYGEIETTLQQLESALASHDTSLAIELLNQWESLGIPPDLLEGFKQIKSLSGSSMFEEAASIANILKTGLPRTR